MWWEHWFDRDLLDKVDQLVARGIVKMEGGRLAVQTSMLVSPYWLHIPGSMDCRNCTLWYEIFFKGLNIIHSFCRYNCWKVVAKPRNVKELIQYRNLMYVVPFVYNFPNPLPGKAGMDVRRHTSGPYAAFNYALSLTEALRIKEIMHYMTRTYMPTEKIDGKHLEDTIFVKRSCTEFEAKIPTDDPWWNKPQTAAEVDIERRLEEIFKCDVQFNFQPAWLVDKTFSKWLDYANAIGDKSLAEIGVDNLSVNSCQYTGDNLKPKGAEDPVKPKPKSKKRTNQRRKKNGSRNQKD